MSFYWPRFHERAINGEIKTSCIPLWDYDVGIYFITIFGCSNFYYSGIDYYILFKKLSHFYCHWLMLSCFISKGENKKELFAFSTALLLRYIPTFEHPTNGNSKNKDFLFFMWQRKWASYMWRLFKVILFQWFQYSSSRIGHTIRSNWSWSRPLSTDAHWEYI